MQPLKVTATVANGFAPTVDVQVDRYILCMPDGTLAVEGFTREEMEQLISRLVRATVHSVCESAYERGYESGMACEDDRQEANFARIRQDRECLRDVKVQVVSGE